MTLLARATAPLAPLDPALNALSDLGNKVTPWMWWPIDPPKKTESYDIPRLGLVILWCLVPEVLEAVVPEDAKSSGRARTISQITAVVLSAATVGAWDRRAERLQRRRRPWRRVLDR